MTSRVIPIIVATPMDSFINAPTPAFARENNKVSIFLLQIRIERPLVWKIWIVINRLLQLPGVAIRYCTGSSWSAFGIAVVRVGKKDSLVGDSIEVRSFHIGNAMHRRAVTRGIIGNDEQDIWSGRLASPVQAAPIEKSNRSDRIITI